MVGNIECPVYVVGELVFHKLGFKCLIHAVTKELRNNDGTVVQELTPEEYIYLLGYQDTNGKMEFVKVNHPVFDKYAG